MFACLFVPLLVCLRDVCVSLFVRVRRRLRARLHVAFFWDCVFCYVVSLRVRVFTCVLARVFVCVLVCMRFVCLHDHMFLCC